MRVAILLLAALIGCKESVKWKNTLFLSTISDPKSFNEIIAKETSTTFATGFMFEGLVRVDGVTTQILPHLAESWKVSEDGLVWEFKLREGVRWFDGEDFTAEDVVFTFNSLIYNPKIPASARDIFTIKGKRIKVEALSPYKVRFTLPAPFAPFLRNLAQPILPSHALMDAVKEERFCSVWGIDTPPVQIIGTGPFMLREYKPSEYLLYVRNPHYWMRDEEGRQLPYLERVVVYIVENQDVELLNFLAGELDVISVRGKDYAYLAQFCKKKGFSLYECGPAFGSNFLAFNQNPNRSSKKLRWFRDINFRRAVAYLLDKESMVKNALGGWGYKQWGPMHPQTPFFHPKLKKYDYDPEIARKILQKTGYKDRDGDGWLEDEKGEKLSFTLITNSENTVRRDIGAIICQDLRSVGMDVKFLPMDFNSLVVKLTSTHDWDAVLIGLTGGVEPHFGKNVWESTGHLHFWNPCPSKKQKDYKKKFDVWRKNLAPWEREVDTLFNEGATTLKMEERVRIYRRWQELVAENLPLLYTVRPATIYAIRDRVKNAKPTAFGGALHNMEKLYVID